MRIATTFPLGADRDASAGLKSLRNENKEEGKGLRAPSKMRWGALSYSDYP